MSQIAPTVVSCYVYFSILPRLGTEERWKGGTPLFVGSTFILHCSMRSFLWFCPLRGQVWTGGPWGRQDRPFALRSPSGTVANGGLRAGHLWSLPWPVKPSWGLCGLTVPTCSSVRPGFLLGFTPSSSCCLTLRCRQPALISFQSSFTRLADAQQVAVSVAGCSAWASWSDSWDPSLLLPHF